MKVSHEFKAAFDLVMETFETPAEEIEECKALVAANFAASEAGFFATAAMIRAGWRPLGLGAEQASTFLARQGELYVHSTTDEATA